MVRPVLFSHEVGLSVFSGAVEEQLVANRADVVKGGKRREQCRSTQPSVAPTPLNLPQYNVLSCVRRRRSAPLKHQQPMGSHRGLWHEPRAHDVCVRAPSDPALRGHGPGCLCGLNPPPKS